MDEKKKKEIEASVGEMLGIPNLEMPHMSDEVIENCKRDAATRPGSTLQCRCCEAAYQRGNWDFYALCPGCFSIFDAQKMKGRDSIYTGGQPIAYYESATDWIESRKAQA